MALRLKSIWPLLQTGLLLSGAVLTETIFGWPGLGRYATTSAVSLDLPAVMGVTLVAAVVYPVVNMLVDIGYHMLDPRIRVGTLPNMMANPASVHGIKGR